MGSSNLVHRLDELLRLCTARNTPSVARSQVQCGTETAAIHPSSPWFREEPVVLGIGKASCVRRVHYRSLIADIPCYAVVSSPSARILVLPRVPLHRQLHACALRPPHSDHRSVSLQCIRSRRSDCARTSERPVSVPMDYVHKRGHKRSRRLPPLGSGIRPNAAVFLRHHLRCSGMSSLPPSSS